MEARKVNLNESHVGAISIFISNLSSKDANTYKLRNEKLPFY